MEESREVVQDGNSHKLRSRELQLRNREKLIFVLLALFVIGVSVVTYTLCVKEEKVAIVVSAYQPLVSGMVHTWIEVRFDDNSTAHVILPDDNNIWNDWHVFI